MCILPQSKNARGFQLSCNKSANLLVSFSSKFNFKIILLLNVHGKNLRVNFPNFMFENISLGNENF